MKEYKIYRMWLQSANGNKLDDRDYIGCTGKKNISYRISEHRSFLKKGKHATVALQEAYNELVDQGKKVDFGFEVLERVEAEYISEVSHIETMHIQRFDEQALFNTMQRSYGPYGEFSGRTELTWEIVREIRRLWNTKKYSHQQLADMFGITKSGMRGIVRNETWVDESYIPYKPPRHSGRRGRGYGSKLDQEKVIEILRLLQDPSNSLTSIADRFGVSDTLICDIKHGRAWSHVTISDESGQHPVQDEEIDRMLTDEQLENLIMDSLDWSDDEE